MRLVLRLTTTSLATLSGNLFVVVTLWSLWAGSRCWWSPQPVGPPWPLPLCGELPLRTMVLPSLLKLLNVFLRQSTFTKAVAVQGRCRPSCCPPALMPRPPGLSLSCHRGWEAKEQPRCQSGEGREVRKKYIFEHEKTTKLYLPKPCLGVNVSITQKKHVLAVSVRKRGRVYLLFPSILSGCVFFMRAHTLEWRQAICLNFSNSPYQNKYVILSVFHGGNSALNSFR